MLADQTPEPAVGQVWADNDPRSAGRELRVYAVNAWYVFLRDVNGSRTTRVMRSRLRPTSTGYRYLRTEPVEGGAPDA